MGRILHRLAQWHESRLNPLVPMSTGALSHWGSLMPDCVFRAIKGWRDKKIAKLLEPFVRKANEFAYVSEDVQDEDSAKAPIWICWWQGEENMPVLVEACIRSVRKNAGRHPVVLLTEENYTRYVGLSPHIEEILKKGTLSIANFTDILRMNLLFKYGGMWLDATIWVDHALDESIFTKDFFTIKGEPFGHYVSGCRWAGFAIAGKRGNPLFARLVKTYETYLESATAFDDYFITDHMIAMFYSTVPEIKGMIDDVEPNNPEVHSLDKILCSPYDGEKYADMTRATNLFKLSYKCHSAEDFARADTFFARLAERQ